jgi:branched-chain amino acid aminotransferase
MYYNEKTIVYLDGKWIKASEANVSLYSQTFHYGNGVFEGIRSYETPVGPSVFKAVEHYQRLLNSAKVMHIPLKQSVEELVSITYKLLLKNKLQNAYIRPLVYMGENMGLTTPKENHLFLAAWEWDRFLGNSLIKIMISSFQRPNPKSCHVYAKVVGHYTNSILATNEAKSKGYNEALLMDSNGYIAEGPGANFFYEKDGVLYTPPEGNILPGITRTTVMELARDMGIEIRERYFGPEVLEDVDSAFFTGTAAEVAGIQSINNKKVKLKWEDSLGYNLHWAYMRRVTEKEITDFSLA